MRKLFRTMFFVVIGLMLYWSSVNAQTFNFNNGNSSIYIRAFSGLEYVRYSFYNNDEVPNMRYNRPVAEIFLGPWYLDYFQKPQDTFGTFVQEFYFFKGITKTNPLENLESPVYPRMYE